MALKEPYMVKYFSDVQAGELIADPGQSLLIKDIYFFSPDTSGYLTIRVDKVLTTFYRLIGKAGCHLAFPDKRGHLPTMMGYLAAKGVTPFIPVAEGQTVTISPDVTFSKIVLVYEIHDAGDITPDMVNGSAAKEYVFINYITNLSAIAADGEYLLDKDLCPAEFPDFPVGKDVPAKTRIEILGIVGSPLGYSGATQANQGVTKFLKLVKGRDTLHDEDRDGLLFWGAEQETDGESYDALMTVVGPLTPDVKVEPLWFPEPLVFEAGEELNCYVNIQDTVGAGIPADKLDVAFIERVVKLE